MHMINYPVSTALASPSRRHPYAHVQAASQEQQREVRRGRAGPAGRGPIAFGSVEGKNQALVDVSSRNLHQTGGEDTGADDSGTDDSGTVDT
jgi:hypothetical protein